MVYFFKLGCMVTPHWGRGWVAWLLPTGGEGGLHGYSPLGERVGFMVTSCWGSCFWLLSAGEVGFQGFFPLGERVGCMVAPH